MSRRLIGSGASGGPATGRAFPLPSHRLVVSVFIAVLFVAAAEYFVGWTSIFYPWRLIDNLWSIVLPTAMLSLTYVLRAVRVYRYFRIENGLALCLRLILQHNVLVNLLPMRMGELAFPVLMQRYFSIRAAHAIPGMVWLRLLDLHALLLIVILVAGMFTSRALALAIGAAWMLVLLLAFVCFNKLDILPSKSRGRIGRALRDAASVSPSTFAGLAESWLLTVANWGLKLAIYAWIVKVFASSGYGAALAGAAGGELSSILPVHGFAALGTYEAGIVAAMQIFGTSINDALTGAANLHLLILGSSIALALASLLIPRSRGRSTGVVAG